ncbi:MAG: SpoIIE family protein phosphatase, partial [Acidobacteriota bacterium]
LAGFLLPLDMKSALALGRGAWYEVRFTHGAADMGAAGGGGRGLSISFGDGAAKAGGGAPGELSVGGRKVPPEEVEPGWSVRSSAGGWLGRPLVVWFRAGPEVRRWEDGEVVSGHRAVALLTTSPAAAWRDFMRSPYEIGGGVLVALGIAGAFMAVIYAIVVGLAVIQILTITRSTARLTRGSREVARGNLDHRIPVKRRDQLGDLAVSFNNMAESVREMLAGVAEKERLARELELAREIQEGLLPPAEARHGAFAIHAHFRPEAAVGGDYFDVLPLPDRLIVTLGDVAGHGLSTGLMMAMVKSAVAALVFEGRRGRELLERLNRVLLEQPRRHRTATLVIAELDNLCGEVALTSAGHPPAFLVSPGGDVTEALIPALPLGHPWPDPPASTRLAFAPGSRLVLYSDGLVEALSQSGSPLGYEALRTCLSELALLPGRELLRGLLNRLDQHLEGSALADDLTVLVVEHLAPSA